MNAYEFADKLEKSKAWLDSLNVQYKNGFGKYCLLPNEVANMLRQQADDIHELQNLVIWMSGCGYDFKQHPYFNDCMDSLVLRKASKK